MFLETNFLRQQIHFVNNSMINMCTFEILVCGLYPTGKYHIHTIYQVGLMKQFVKVLDKDDASFSYFCLTFPDVSYEKLT